MDQLIERCAGLDVHKKTVAACVRVPGPQGERRQQTRTFPGHDRRAVGAAGLAVRPPGARGRHGVHRHLLEAGVLPAGGRGRMLAAQRPPPAQRPRPQDRRQGRRVDLPAGRARPGPPQLRATTTDPPAARPDSLPQGRHPGAHPRGPAPGEGARRRGHQAVVGGQRRPGGVRPGHARRPHRRQLRPRRHGRAGQGAPARQAPRAAGRAAGPLRPPPRPAGRRDAHRASTLPTPPSGGYPRRSTGLSPRTRGRWRCWRPFLGWPGAPPR